MNGHPHIIVIGTSAGGMPALCQLVEQLRGTLPAAVLVVQHLSPDSSGELLVQRLARHAALPCHLAENDMPIEPGHLYLAPPDRHLLVRAGKLLITKGPRENHYRPAADTLFRSVAAAYGSRAIGVVLTGMLHDGTAGLEFIKRCGGLALVQDPEDAQFPSMPESALRNVAIDDVVPLARLGARLEELVFQSVREPIPVPADIQLEAAIAERVVGTVEEAAVLGDQVPLSCPDCGGSLWQMKHGQVLRYRCHTGHAFTADSLLKESQEGLEESLWVAMRMLEERKTLLTNMAARGDTALNRQYEERVAEIKKHINRLREFMLNGTSGSPQTEH
ncbi:two-component system, chemotaxis family, response regulator CheB [Hymenobacter daecheongensis DSM 21074]|uniref:protein-glutamate methylesterase n=1 Tax=Hymenobacter daecheongensis DSM 21074 TaxID=1121955 RepID=A0A1M6HYW4_9BACT|nr:chemotaxis protein CheB [Hymenobacter daecheongensis]SHJ27343.1 two-component system, chemotaxis family, response regulator CheB [Hymenobacter daecheongensis DSM 21074]